MRGGPSGANIRAAAPLAVLLLGLAGLVHGATATKHVGGLTILADPALAPAASIVVVHLRERRPMGATYVIMDGRRAPVFMTAHGLRALVPVPVGTPAGPEPIGVEIFTRRGRQRVPVDIAVSAVEYPARNLVIPEGRRALLKAPKAITDGRRLLGLLRTESPAALWNGPFQPPVAGDPGPTFGGTVSYVGGYPVEQLLDGVFGEYHRGLDYKAPVGTIVQAPAAGTVLFAGPLTLTGQTVVLDHGQGVLSVFYFLSRTDVHEGQVVEGRYPFGASGDTGIADEPHVHWGVYVHGVAVDPRVVLGSGLE